MHFCPYFFGSENQMQVYRLVGTMVTRQYDKYYYLGLVATKPVFGVSEKARLKSVSSAAETS